MTNDETPFRRTPEERPIEVKPQRARGARTGWPVLYVLLWSVALAVVVLAAVWLYFVMAHH